MNDFQLEDLVETLSGLTKGRIVFIDEETGNIDVQGSNAKYRNCMPIMWRRQIITAPLNAPEPLRRGDPCFIIYQWDGDYYSRSGWVISTQTEQVMIMFEDLDSAWVKREWVAAGHGNNPF